jgi:tetratricopeptide (TPR) repeat protein
LTLQCRVSHQQGQFEQAIEVGEQALAIVEDTAYYQEIAQVHNELGNAFDQFGQPDKAISHFERGLLILERIGDEHGASKIYNNLAGIYYQTAPVQSIEYLTRTLETMKRSGDVWGESTTYQNLGIVSFAQGNYSQAILYYQQSLKVKERLGDNQGIADCHINLGEVFRTQGVLSDAIGHLETALKIGLEINSDQTEAECYRQLAECYLESGDLSKALEACQETLHYARISGDRTREGVIYRVLGKIHQQQDSLAAALEDYARSVTTLQELNQEFDLGTTLIDYAQALRQYGQTLKACVKLNEALIIFDRLNLTAEKAKVIALLEHYCHGQPNSQHSKI